MTTWAKKILAVISIVLGVSMFSYLHYQKSHVSIVSLKEQSIVTPTTTPQEQVILSQTQEPIALTPAKPKVPIPVPEPALPIGTDRFTVGLTATTSQISENLFKAGFITDTENFMAKLDTEKTPVSPGAYKLSKIMTVAQINKVLHGKPYMKWVVIKPGLRKEEIATLLTTTLGWTTKQKTTWITKDTVITPEYTEGVYYPDTYLIPVTEDQALVAKRLVAKFNENFTAYLPQFTAQNIKWVRALTLASIVQREAANNADMPLIAGILWNRLNQNIALGVDATLQYVRGDTGKGWWAPIGVADKKTDSPFNTYKYKGLPPHPISNPGISAMEAVLHPTKTDCIYYIHDKNRITHCAVTYKEHQANIQNYLIGNMTQQ